ncbi:hypothetical protein FUA26_04570 [Seonamhaeicola algicola]|uniref:Uncharacterized protein n=1 Tax=Seonamhaeicola algicola TaxID=1719036 RepID=A0A5C7AY84_9FLAO|nr:hypothetical protein [Seonamhaeicola algicola]TXE13074.1 hypothetical protein FUA26_04570 [Seonamhaeicola algicola]
MKNVLSHTKTVIVMVAMLATVIANANEISLIKFGKDLRGTALTIENVKEGNLLSIKDIYGITLYKEVIEQSGLYTKGFDLTDLPDGNYFFELEKDMEIKTIPFTVNATKVTFNKTEETTTFKPFVRESNGLVYVTKLALNAEPMEITVYGLDENDAELLLDETIENTKNIERVYKLSAGKYKMVFNFDGKEYTKYINN